MAKARRADGAHDAVRPGGASAAASEVAAASGAEASAGAEAPGAAPTRAAAPGTAALEDAAAPGAGAPAGVAASAGAGPVAGGRLALVFFGLMLAMFISSLSETIAATALPTIVGDLGGVEMMQWVSTAYILTSTITMPIYGKLGDLHGRKRLLMGALGLYAAGKCLCGVAADMTLLIAGRCVSGLGGGGLIILSQAAIADVVPPRKLGTYMGVMGSVFAVSNVLGPLLGGWFVQVTGWRWIFWFTVPLALLAIVVLARCLPREPRREAGPLDAAGMAALTVAVTSLVLGLAWGGVRFPWVSWQIAGLLALAAAGAGAFVAAERRAREPLLPLALFSNRNFVLCSVTGLLLNIGFIGSVNYLPTYFQIVANLSPEAAGLVCTAMSAGIVVATTVTGWLASRTGRYKWMPIAMCAVSALGFGLLSTLQVGQPIGVAVAYLLVLGTGIGLGLQILVLVVQNEFPHAMVGTATAAENFFRQIGSSVGTSLVGALFTARLTADLAGKLPLADNLSLASLTPSAVDHLPAAAQAAVAQGYSEALVPLFLWFVPLMLAGLVLMLFLKQHPLAKTIDHSGQGR